MASGFTTMSRLGQQFAQVNPTGDQPNYLTRYMGGHNRTNHPYISGYWQLFMNIPKRIFWDEREHAENWLHCTAEGFTPPSRSINKVDIPGQGGLGASFISGQTLTRTFTLTFREYQHLPISEIFQRWTAVIDPYTGVSELPGQQWMPYSYKGNCFIIQTKPVGGMARGDHVAGGIDKPIDHQFIEQVWFFHGVFPEGANEDAFTSDIATNDSTQLSITMSFDGWPLTKADPEVVKQALKHLSSWKYQPNTYNDFVDLMNMEHPKGADNTLESGNTARNSL